MEQKLRKKLKACIAGIVVCVLLIAMFGFGVAVTKTSNTSLGASDLQAKVYTKVIIAALPKSITGNDNGKKVTFYMDYNKDFDSSKDEPLRQFLPYYYDDNDKRIDLPTGVYFSPTTGETMQVTIGFFLRGANKLKVVSAVLQVLIVLLVIAAIAGIIVCSFFIWSYKQDIRDAEQYDVIKNRFNKKNNKE